MSQTITPRPFPPVRPHSGLQQCFPDVWTVKGSIHIGMMRFSRNMTVVRQGEDLVLINTVRMDEAGLAALDALGTVRHILRIGGWHGSDDPFYKDRCGCPVSDIQGQRYFEGTTAEKGITYFEADHHLDETSPLPIEGASLYIVHTTPPEGILRLPAGGGTLVTADALTHWPAADAYFNFAGKMGMKLAGMMKSYGMMPPWADKYHPPKAEVAGILELEFNHVIPGHGEFVQGGAVEKFRPFLEAYVAKAKR